MAQQQLKLPRPKVVEVRGYKRSKAKLPPRTKSGRFKKPGK